jgi:hypothetical protein
MMSNRNSCYGNYDYSYTCLRCYDANDCLDYTRMKEDNDMMRNGIGNGGGYNNIQYGVGGGSGSGKQYGTGGVVAIDMGTRAETKEERKARLDNEWEAKLPCANCHSRMQKMCKYYNTFKRPDYPTDIFNIGEITCSDRVDPPTATPLSPFGGVVDSYSQPS